MSSGTTRSPSFICPFPKTPDTSRKFPLLSCSPFCSEPKVELTYGSDTLARGRKSTRALKWIYKESGPLTCPPGSSEASSCLYHLLTGNPFLFQGSTKETSFTSLAFLFGSTTVSPQQTFLQQSFEPGDQSPINSFASMGKSAFKFQTTNLQ